jgi:tetratricopeptide (TPR) repeat protein
VKAGQVFPEEAGSYYLNGLSKMKQKKYDISYNQFEKYEKTLPGNPNTTFYMGYCLEQMERIENAAQEYRKYLEVVNQGEKAQHAYNRLIEWGYVKKQ